MIHEDLFIQYIKNNDLKNVTLFLKDKKIKANYDNNYPIILSSSFGHIDIVRLLLTYEEVNPSDRFNAAICYAAEKGFIDIVKLLLEDKRINMNLDGAIVLACTKGHFDIYDLFLKYNVDPSSDENSCIRSVYEYSNNTAMLDLLWQDKRIKNSLKNDDLKLYNKLIKKDIKEKVESF